MRVAPRSVPGVTVDILHPPSHLSLSLAGKIEYPILQGAEPVVERVTHFRGGHKPSAPPRQPPPQRGPPRKNTLTCGSTQAVRLGRGAGGDRGLPGKWLGLGNSREDGDWHG